MDQLAHFRHVMPFGAAPEASGTRFQLWAPAQRRIAVAIGDKAERILPMTDQGNGMFGVFADDVKPGARYQFVLGDNFRVPDPASRFQPDDVHGPSEVIDPLAYRWENTAWRGRQWEEAIIYELHVGCFSPTRDFDGIRDKLDYLVESGVTALELMPVADFEGRRNWGYDGVLLFAPDSVYGRPEQLKRLVDEAHGRGLMVFLDVVYNHFGPSGNYLHLYAPDFFTDRYKTPWGSAINFEDRKGYVRSFFINNALYWLNEYRFDGLRFDAVHAICDETNPSIMEEIAESVRRHTDSTRRIHLILENDKNESRYLNPAKGIFFDAQWNDDFHHAAHVIATGETYAHYADYAAIPVAALAVCLAQGFYYQGMPSGFRGGASRGESIAPLLATSFVDFLQNHDQIGNRADGGRLAMLVDQAPTRAFTAIMMLSPHIPMLFMGEEWGSKQPFYYFCDFEGELADAVRKGRKKEFEHQFAAEQVGRGTRFTDPNSPETFQRSMIDWDEKDRESGAAHLTFVRHLVAVRRQFITPHLATMPAGAGHYQAADDRALYVRWQLGAGHVLTVASNLSSGTIVGLTWLMPGEEIFATPEPATSRQVHALSPWAVRVSLS